jgi:hypothetical protein
MWSGSQVGGSCSVLPLGVNGLEQGLNPSMAFRNPLAPAPKPP